jgi:hypothetical protein
MKGVSTRPGSLATEIDFPHHVRFAPDSDQIADIAGPFRANFGREQPLFNHNYSGRHHSYFFFKPDKCVRAVFQLRDLTHSAIA